MSQITVVMYHYVREIKKSNYPGIKGLEMDGFRRQLDFLSEKFNLITAQDVISCTKGEANLPPNACWLTFDDGYKDHHQFVLPELVKRKIQGSFFPPVKPVADQVMLDVNSIHYILASTPDKNSLVKRLNELCLSNKISSDELSHLWSTYGVANRFDPKEVMYFKRMLQHALPFDIRSAITSQMLKEFVGLDDSELAKQLYMSTEEVKDLVEAGMYVGSHGYSHLWLNHESYASQENEIDRSLEFLDEVGAPTEDWIMCYPYGAYNQDTIAILQKKKCALAITTEVKLADLSEHHPLALPRFDTNDFPQ
jgi:peptidoglycan/xylan/chitin deacetylase (PgdA/CDA1 family)